MLRSSVANGHAVDLRCERIHKNLTFFRFRLDWAGVVEVVVILTNFSTIPDDVVLVVQKVLLRGNNRVDYLEDRSGNAGHTLAATRCGRSREVARTRIDRIGQNVDPAARRGLAKSAMNVIFTVSGFARVPGFSLL